MARSPSLERLPKLAKLPQRNRENIRNKCDVWIMLSYLSFSLPGNTAHSIKWRCPGVAKVLFGMCIGQTVRSQIRKKRNPRTHRRGFFRALRDQIPYVRKAPGSNFVTPY
nr:hypothetical transcript [Hymenolepis microstoma]